MTEAEFVRAELRSWPDTALVSCAVLVACGCFLLGGPFIVVGFLALFAGIWGVTG